MQYRLQTSVPWFFLLLWTPKVPSGILWTTDPWWLDLKFLTAQIPILILIPIPIPNRKSCKMNENLSFLKRKKKQLMHKHGLRIKLRYSEKATNFGSSSTFYLTLLTLTCRIIVQQILYLSYTYHRYKICCSIIRQVRVVASNYKWKMGQIFVAFSEYLNFTQGQNSST